MTRIAWLCASIAFYLLFNSPDAPPQSGQGDGGGQSDDLNSHIAFSDRVLIVRDPQALEPISYDPVPTPLGDLTNFASFKTLLEQAGAKQFDAAKANWGLTDVPLGRLLGGWMACADGTKCLDTAPFRLLALTFRPDLANFRCGEAQEGDSACSAEVHFEFGQTVPGIGLEHEQTSIIVEFSVSKQSKRDLQALIGDWTKLAAIAAPEGLAEALQEKWIAHRSQFDSVKVRLMAKVGTRWEFRQYGFSSDGKLQLANALPGEIAPGKWLAAPCKLTDGAKAFLQDFNGDVQTIPAGFLQPSAIAPAPSVFEVGDAFSRNIRFAIGSNTCSGCHSTETMTPVLHIRGRERGAKSKLSPFLTGNSSQNGEPTLGQHLVTDPGKCNGEDPAAPKRGFNDLLRRKQWIQAVLAFDASQRNWTQMLREKSLSIQSIH